MGHIRNLVALSIIAVAAPLAAAQPEPAAEAGAPAAEPGARYCLRIEPETGSRIEEIRCETRQEWAELGVDLDREWPREGVRIIA